jgi:hypothetical protein
MAAPVSFSRWFGPPIGAVAGWWGLPVVDILSFSRFGAGAA